VLEVGEAVALHLDDLAVADDGDREPGDAALRDLRGQVLVDGVRVGAERREEQRDDDEEAEGEEDDQTPPVTSMVTPVTKSASLDARKQITRA
jgi:hypothetical protein